MFISVSLTTELETSKPQKTNGNKNVISKISQANGINSTCCNAQRIGCVLQVQTVVKSGLNIYFCK